MFDMIILWWENPYPPLFPLRPRHQLPFVVMATAFDLLQPTFLSCTPIPVPIFSNQIPLTHRHTHTLDACSSHPVWRRQSHPSPLRPPSLILLLFKLLRRAHACQFSAFCDPVNYSWCHWSLWATQHQVVQSSNQHAVHVGVHVM